MVAFHYQQWNANFYGDMIKTLENGFKLESKLCLHLHQEKQPNKGFKTYFKYYLNIIMTSTSFVHKTAFPFKLWTCCINKFLAI